MLGFFASLNITTFNKIGIYAHEPGHKLYVLVVLYIQCIYNIMYWWLYTVQCIYIYIYIYMYINFNHYKSVSYGKRSLPHSSGKHECNKLCLPYETDL